MSDESVINFLSNNPEYEDILKRIVEFEENNKKDTSIADKRDIDTYWEYDEVETHPSRLNKLVTEGMVDKIMSTNSVTYYKLSNLQSVRSALEKFNSMFEEGTRIELHEYPEPEDLPDNLFDEVVGYDDIKWLLKRGLTNDSITNFMFIGPPGSAKTVFLLSMRKHLNGTVFIDAGGASGAGFTEEMFESKPKYVLIDELDNMERGEQTSLASYMDTGIVSETKYDKNREMKTNTKTIAAANSTDPIRDEIVDRCTDLYFDAYDKKEFLDVCVNILPEQEGVTLSESKKIGEAVWDMEGGRVRKAIQTARLSDGDPEKVLQVLENYSPEKGTML